MFRRDIILLPHIYLPFCEFRSESRVPKEMGRVPHTDSFLFFFGQREHFGNIAYNIIDDFGVDGSMREVEEADIDSGIAELFYELGSGSRGKG